MASTLKTTIVQEPSSAVNNLTLDTSGGVTVGQNLSVSGTASITGATTFTTNVTSSGTVVMSSPYTMRNKIINGAMVIDQRNAGASVTPTNGQYSVDRWYGSLTQSSKFSLQQSSTAPSGFSNSLVATVLSAATVGAGDIFLIGQRIEGFNTSDLAWGTSSAKTVILSFWVRSSITGSYGVGFQNNSTDRSYVQTYTINSANTWEYKTITIPGDQSGTWNTTNGIGILIGFSLGTGSTWETTAGSWASGAYYATSGTTDWITNASATFYITGVQLEQGTVATPFEYRNYQQELAMCQRYYEKSYDIATVPGSSSTNGPVVASVGSQSYGRGGTMFQVRKRAVPTVSFWSTNGVSGQADYWNNGATGTASLANSNIGETAIASEIQFGGPWTSRAYFYFQWTASAEL